MNPTYIPYTTTDSDFYDAAWAGDRADEGPLRLSPEDIPPDWHVRVQGPWVAYRGPGELPDTGWKIHVATTPARAGEVVPLVVRRCIAEGITCKSLRSRRIVSATQHKYAARSSAGKVITIYPPDDATLQRTVQWLRVLLQGEPGARIIGDVPVPEAPIGLRYGAFREAWTLDDAGRLVPGRREGAAVVADPRRPGAAQPSLPLWLQHLVAQADPPERLPISDVQLLHRSNGGGVYAATWADGRRVVLKEARHHTGYDAGGADAVARLQHEWSALQRLSGSGTAPEPVAYLTVGDSDMLVMEHVAGTPVSTLMATRHPAILPGSGEAEAAEYRGLCDSVLMATRQTLDRIHRLGVVHLDIHPANVLRTDHGVVLIDLESSAVDGVAVARGVATPAAWAGDDLTPGADLHALEVLGRAMRDPMTVAVSRRIPAQPRMPDGTAATPIPGAPQHEPTMAGLVQGIVAAATPERTDRLFPGDIAQFQIPGAGAGLLHGAAGVLLALHLVGEAPRPEWLHWLERRLQDGSVPGRGLGDGVDGVAYALAMMGETDLLTQVAPRLLHTPGDDGPGDDGLPPLTHNPNWTSGRVGMAIAAATAAQVLGSDELMDVALRHCAAVLDAVQAAEIPSGLRPGLTQGWSGVCLGLLRVADTLAETDHADHTVTQSSLRHGARAALDREHPFIRRQRTAIHALDDRRVLPYLGIGSAAMGLAEQAMQSHLPSPVGPEIMTGVAQALRPDIVVGGGLLAGRAGLALALARLEPEDGAIDRHVRGMHWYAVPGENGSHLMLGDQNLRCSTDLATGSAGALALGWWAVGQLRDPLHDLLGLPAASRLETADAANPLLLTDVMWTVDAGH